MTRVIAGQARGRRLAVPPGQRTRPTSDRAREGLFSTIISLIGPLDGQRVLDLFAGSGAVGLEALSRGAAHVTLVEQEPAAIRTIRANIEAVGLDGAAIAGGKVDRVLSREPPEPYDLVFADPPYKMPAAELIKVLTSLNDNGYLSSNALVVIERATRSGELDWPAGYQPARVRRYGETSFWYGHAEKSER